MMQPPMRSVALIPQWAADFRPMAGKHLCEVLHLNGLKLRYDGAVWMDFSDGEVFTRSNRSGSSSAYRTPIGLAI
jgi:hypothetical protein